MYILYTLGTVLLIIISPFMYRLFGASKKEAKKQTILDTISDLFN